MLLADVAATSRATAATSGRLAKVALLAALLRELTPSEAPVVVCWLAGELPQRQIGVGWAALRSVPAPAEQARLTVADVDSGFSAIKDSTGSGSQERRRALLADIFARATAVEQEFLHGLLGGGLRQGALAGVMADAIASAVQLPIADVRRAAMLRGDLAVVAATALAEGASGLARFQLEVGRPISPMLAQTATSVEQAMQTLGGPVLVEWKLDGARIQVHRSGPEVKIFTRSLDDVTARMPEVVAAILALPVDELVADGEVIAMRSDGRPYPFQRTAARLGTTTGREQRGDQTRLTPYLFDLLRINDQDLLGAPTSERVRALDELIPPTDRIGAIITDDPARAQQFFRDTLDLGHEGVMVKSLDAPYEAGRRGSGWLKVKPVHTLDLVVLAVEWGSGRRQGWLSNIHLGAREGDGFIMLGKTFKGMTDSMLAWQTQRFWQLATGPADDRVVRVRPEQVVEIAFDGVQTSSRYPGGVALRFARVVRYRDDKTAADADTLDMVRSFLPAG